jgi:hypothetical protein
MVSNLEWYGDKVQRKIVASILDTLESTADELLRKANETIPFETGALAQSGQVDIEPAALKAVVSYNTPYAIRQHEDVSLRHPNPLSANSSPNGRARWLELTAQEQADRLHRWFGSRMKTLLGGIS